MAKKKYYAVKVGNKPGIYETWAECEIQVKGVSGAQYKSFTSMNDAEKYISGCEDSSIESDCMKKETEKTATNEEIEYTIKELQENEVVAFVDGSYNSKEEKSGFGVIIVDEKGVETSLYRAFTKQYRADFLELRNVSAELEGVKEAIKWAIAYNKSKITIFYDYAGIEKWADGSWKANKEITKQYVSFIKEKKLLINIKFCKVAAHTGIEYNEMADTLAKNSLLEKGYKTYDDGSIYFVGYSKEDWEAIIECINEENANLIDSFGNTISIETKSENRKQRMIITDSKNKVVINCYPINKSYVQGKQSVLFQKIISTAIEGMSDKQVVIETLNHFHVMTITQEQVEIKFELLLPDYKGNRSGKFFNNLLAAVYNTMVTGYKPDYTEMLTPTFRAYEYFLHKILGEKMGLNTTDKNGKNNFGYFRKNGKDYECSAGEVSKLSDNQVKYLNELYNAYHYVRHEYTHWSADDLDTAVISNIELAHEHLKKGLTLANKYYKLF